MLAGYLHGRWYTCTNACSDSLFTICPISATPATVHAQLRSSVTLQSLSIRRTKTRSLGPRGFYFASSAASLPVHLRDPDLSLNSFKTKLKTHFFFLISSLSSHSSCFLFFLRANVIVYKLARANVCIELKLN